LCTSEGIHRSYSWSRCVARRAHNRRFPERLEECCDDFARSLRRRNRSAATIGIYRKAFNRFWRWALEVGIYADPAAVTTQDVNAYTDKQIARGIAATTFAIGWLNLRPLFTWWAKETNASKAFDGADVPQPDEPTIPVIDLDHIRAVLKACNGRDFASRRDEAIIRVLFDTGCRLGDLVALSIDDWDRRHDYLHLRGKTGEGVVPISASTGEALARYVHARDVQLRGRDDRADALAPARRGVRGKTAAPPISASPCG
jgi:site-specific recombinase XerD